MRWTLQWVHFIQLIRIISANKRDLFDRIQNYDWISGVGLSIIKYIVMTYARNCPNCNKELVYTNQYNLLAAERKNTKCFSCGMNNRRNYSGENNPFFGQKHTETVKQKISHFNSEIRELSEEFIQQAKENLAKVTNDRPLYDVWHDKYGKEEADRRLVEFKKKQSILNSGEKNNMYGKPSPQGSGNGWSGWYNEWYFRSLRELSYMVNVIEKEKLTWRCPDKDFKISYQDYTGATKTYFPDFIINETRIVEIKPKKLHDTPKVLAKKLAAEAFCLSKAMTYEIIDPPILDEERIKNMYLNGQVKFLNRYEEKFKKKYLI
jgi:hypothetical protein